MSSNIVGTMLPLDEFFTDHDHFYTCQKCKSKDEEISNLQREISTLKEQLRYKTKENGKLLKNLEDLTNPNPSLPKSKKIHQDITRNTLQKTGTFSTAVIDIALRGATDTTKISETPRSYKWTNADYIKGLKAKSIGNNKSLLFTRRNICPLPGETTIRNKFSFFQVQPGIITPVKLYLKNILPGLKPEERLAKMAFDEGYILSLCYISRANLYHILVSWIYIAYVFRLIH